VRRERLCEVVKTPLRQGDMLEMDQEHPVHINRPTRHHRESAYEEELVHLLALLIQGLHSACLVKPTPSTADS
jgi:hypothetical protein